MAFVAVVQSAVAGQPGHGLRLVSLAACPALGLTRLLGPGRTKLAGNRRGPAERGRLPWPRIEVWSPPAASAGAGRSYSGSPQLRQVDSPSS